MAGKSTPSPLAAVFVPAGQASRTLDLGGLGVVFKVTAAETGGLFSVVEHPIEPRILVPPHMHTREDEFSYVLEGEIGARIGEQEFRAGPGSYIFKPRRVPHTFWNPTDRPARLIEFIVPGGFEEYFAEVVKLIRAGARPGEPEQAALMARYGNTSDGMEWVPELVARYGLKFAGRPAAAAEVQSHG